MVDLRINETLQTGAVRRPPLPFSRLVGTVSNSADVVRFPTAPTGGESVYLFLEFTIILRAGQVREDPSVPRPGVTGDAPSRCIGRAIFRLAAKIGQKMGN